MRILLAEDNPGDVLLVKLALKHHRIAHELHVLKDGEEALRYLGQMGTPNHAPCPDVLLLDLNLPKVDGPQVLREFRKHPGCSQTPVIVITSSEAKSDRARTAQLSIARFFTKPIDLDAYLLLGAVIREVVEERVTESRRS